MEDVLVLSDGFLPLGRVDWRRAICWIFSGRVAVVEVYPDRVVRSPSTTMQMPSVVRFVNRVRGMFRRSVTFNRRNVWVRDGGRCGYCGSGVRMSEFTFDHVVPRRLGGVTSWENIVVSCYPCNQRKADRTPDEAGMRLMHRPAKPKSAFGVYTPVLCFEEGMPSSWKDWLGSIDYWHGKIEEG